MPSTTIHRTSIPSPATERGSSLQGPMRLADLVYGAWAITPAMLDEIEGIYLAHLRGPKLDAEAIEAKLGRPLANKPQSYEVINGVAVLPIEGVIAPKANLFTQISGGASAQLLAREMRAAGADPAVKSVLQVLDTPGGNVLGVPEYAQAVRDVASAKPVVAITDGHMASAGYWFGSSANHVYATGPTVEVGSIGVITKRVDQSAANEKLGIKVDTIYAGKYKAVGDPNRPMTKAEREHIQASIDYCYSLFVDAVAANRGVSVETVLEHMAGGRLFRGQQALDAGLIDGFSTIDALIESMATDPARYAKRTTARIAVPGSPKSASAGAAHVDTLSATHEGASMDTPENKGAATPSPITAESMQRDHPRLHAELMAAGAAAERERVAAVRAQSLPGHEALIEALVADGKTTGPEAAVAVLAAERTTQAAAAKAHAADAPEPVAGATPPADKGTKTRAEQAEEAKAYAEVNKVGFVTAMKKLGFA